jgi:ATP-dependent DNA helicase PIF1
MSLSLSPEQQTVFNAYLAGQNVFVTGPGGTGKTHLIKAIYNDALKQKKPVQVCALTGCAALLLECSAKTVHSWAKIGLGKGSDVDILSKILKYRKTKPWLSTKLLIIDEVSMMSMRLFELLDYLGRKIRKKEVPFGGIQVIFSGDFYQLPPVPDKGDEASAKFCFESPRWQETFHKQIELRRNFRQADLSLASVLNQIRTGVLDASGRDLLHSRIGLSLPPDSLVIPTKLFPRKYSVELINNSEMQKIDTDEYIYEPVLVTDEVNPNVSENAIEEEAAHMQNHALFDELVCLKKGAQVMCIANIDLEDAKICNGSVGIVTGFSTALDGCEYPTVKFQNGTERVMARHSWPSENIKGLCITQVPLILAWAITIHKAQGATLDLLELDIGSDVFEYGQTYVGLSRVRSLEGLYISEFMPDKIKANPKVHTFYETMNVLAGLESLTS